MNDGADRGSLESGVDKFSTSRSGNCVVVDCEFRFNGGKNFLVGCDATKHVGRLIITDKNLKLAEDSTEVT